MMKNLEKLYEIFKKYRFISTDSRTIREGSIFWAFKGDNYDGNMFVEESFSKGAIAAVTTQSELADEAKNIFYVPDAIKALQDFAIIHRNNLKIPIIAITGTNGKTTTKELIATVLSQKYRVSYTSGNLNNHIGVPLTILAINHTIDIAVIEMGANHPHEIKDLCNIVKPTHGLITNIGIAHLEGFGNFEQIKQTKAALYEYLIENKGTLFNNADNTILTELLNGYFSFSYGKQKAYCTGEFVSLNMKAAVKWNSDKASGFAKSNLIGEYNFENILAAITVGLFFEVPAVSIDIAIANYTPNNNRSQICETNKNTLIKDFYNANPISMSLSIENFAKIDNNNKCLILGDMLELGTESGVEHKKIIEQISKLNFKTINLIGKHFYEFKNNYPFNFFETVEDFEKFMVKYPEHSKLILIKGSRGIKLEKCIDYL